MIRKVIQLGIFIISLVWFGITKEIIPLTIIQGIIILGIIEGGLSLFSSIIQN